MKQAALATLVLVTLGLEISYQSLVFNYHIKIVSVFSNEPSGPLEYYAVSYKLALRSFIVISGNCKDLLERNLSKGVS